MLTKLDEPLQRLLRYAAAGHGFLLTCAALALAGTMTAAFPVTAVVVPTVLLAPERWKNISLSTAVGSALGATLLVMAIHQIGWSSLYDRYPQLTAHPDWAAAMSWAEAHGAVGLLLLAASPLPQTPVLIFFGITQQNYLGVFLAMLVGKLLKYALFAWMTKRFPGGISNGFTAWWQRFKAGER